MVMKLLLQARLGLIGLGGTESEVKYAACDLLFESFVTAVMHMDKQLPVALSLCRTESPPMHLLQPVD